MSTNRHKSLLGIAFGDGGVSAVLARRHGDEVRVSQVVSAPLSLDLLAGAPELLGLELAQLLRQAEIRERDCVVCVPLAWALCLRVDLPDIPEADVHDFLLTQAEREFDTGPADLSLAVSRFQTPEGAKGATLVAVQAAHLLRLRQILKAARLRVVAFTLGITALAMPVPGNVEAGVTLVLGGTGADMAITGLGGLLSLRQIAPGAEERAGAGLDPVALARQLRITFGLLPTALRQHVTRLRVLGDPVVSGPFLAEAGQALAALALTAEALPAEVRGEVPREDPGPAGRARELAAHAAILQGLLHQAPALELKLARSETIRALWRQQGVRLLLYLAGATALAALTILTVVLVQKIQLAHLSAVRARIAPDVRELQQIRDRVRELRPWLSDEPDALRLLQVLTNAFPEDGVVWATDLKIKGLSEVSVSGKASDRQAWFVMQERLRQTPGVTDLRLSQSRENAEGSDPLTFSLNFRWQPGGGNGSKD